jgi:hypothetical protein
MRKKKRDPWAKFWAAVFRPTPFQRAMRYRMLTFLEKSRRVKGFRHPSRRTMLFRWQR